MVVISRMGDPLWLSRLVMSYSMTRTVGPSGTV
jgi:hypothetical protein